MSRPGEPDLQHYLNVADRIVQEAHLLVRPLIDRRPEIQHKPDGSPVTGADYAVEDFLRKSIRSAFPEHGILGEERGEVVAESGFQWIIDPIDGTRSYSRGLPLYGTLLALRHDDHPVVGVIHLPELDLMYAGATGLGVRCNGRPLELADLPDEGDIADEIIAIGDRRQFVACGQEALFDGLIQAAPTVRTYTDCFGHALALDGRVGAMIDVNVRLWDITATEVLVREAGGRFALVDRRGPDDPDDPEGPESDRFDIVFGKPRVVAWILERIDAGR